MNTEHIIKAEATRSKIKTTVMLKLDLGLSRYSPNETCIQKARRGRVQQLRYTHKLFTRRCVDFQDAYFFHATTLELLLVTPTRRSLNGGQRGPCT